MLCPAGGGIMFLLNVGPTYKTPVIVTQRTEYISTTVINLSSYKSGVIGYCKFWGFHGGDYEERCLLGCYDVWLL
jgi:hypothetical protein